MAAEEVAEEVADEMITTIFREVEIRPTTAATTTASIRPSPATTAQIRHRVAARAIRTTPDRTSAVVWVPAAVVAAVVPVPT